MTMQKWVVSNLTQLVATAGLTCAMAAGLFVTISQVRCTLLEEDVARLKGRLTEEMEALRAEQETNQKTVLSVVTETARLVAARQEDESKETPETPAGVAPIDQPKGGIE
jgi:hypothetical protein